MLKDTQNRILYGCLMSMTVLGSLAHGWPFKHSLLFIVASVATVEWWYITRRLAKPDYNLNETKVYVATHKSPWIILIALSGYCLIASFVACMLLLKQESLFALFAIVWSTDIFAYIAGNAIRGPLLCASISPQKTYAGLGGGLMFGTLAGLAFRLPLVVCLASACFAQIGDLLESMVKRAAHLKDSNVRLSIPGHGGILDRIDALLFATPVFTYLLWYFNV